MYILNDTAALQRALDSPVDRDLSAILTMRVNQQLGDALFIIVEPRDALAEIEDAAGFPIATNVVDGSTYPHPDFVPSWEWCRVHPGWSELIYLLTDDDAGTAILVPRRNDIDTTLAAILRTFADSAYLAMDSDVAG